MQIHNGNLTNTQDLREELTGYKDGKTFVRYLRTQSDSEVLLNVFADAIGRFHELQPNTDTVDTIFGACMTTMNKCQGAYSCITLINNVRARRRRRAFTRRAEARRSRPGFALCNRSAYQQMRNSNTGQRLMGQRSLGWPAVQNATTSPARPRVGFR